MGLLDKLIDKIIDGAKKKKTDSIIKKLAKEKGISVKDMAKDPEAEASKKTTKKADAKKTTAKE